MSVAHVECDDPHMSLIAFAANGTQEADAGIVINQSEESLPVNLTIRGVETRYANAFVTTDVDFGNRNYEPLGKVDVKNGRLKYRAPARSVTPFSFE
jgi:hypothetical protein